MVVQEGYDYCSLCRLYATDGHLQSKKHKTQVEWNRWWETQALLEDDPEQEKMLAEALGNPAHFERRGDWMWCLLCKCWAVNGHLIGQRHQKKLEWELWPGPEPVSLPALTAAPSQPALPQPGDPAIVAHVPVGREAVEDIPSLGNIPSHGGGEEIPSPGGGEAIGADALAGTLAVPAGPVTGAAGLPWGADAAHFEWRDGWWCLLCNQWLGKGHIVGRKHQKRLMWTEWYEGKDDDTESTGIPSNAITCSDREDGSPEAVQEALEDASNDPWGPAWSRSIGQPPSASEQHWKPHRPATATQSQRAQSQPHSSAAATPDAASSSAATPSTGCAAAAPSSGWNHWKSAYSERHQRVYYYNTVSGERSWQHPQPPAALATVSSQQTAAPLAASRAAVDVVATKRTLEPAARAATWASVAQAAHSTIGTGASSAASSPVAVVAPVSGAAEVRWC